MKSVRTDIHKAVKLGEFQGAYHAFTYTSGLARRGQQARAARAVGVPTTTLRRWARHLGVPLIPE